MLTREACAADIERYQRLKREIATLNDQCEALRARILRYMDEARTDRVNCDTVTAVRYRQYRNQVDLKALELDHPGLVAEYRHEKLIVGLKVL